MSFLNRCLNKRIGINIIKGFFSSDESNTITAYVALETIGTEATIVYLPTRK